MGLFSFVLRTVPGPGSVHPPEEPSPVTGHRKPSANGTPAQSIVIPVCNNTLRRGSVFRRLEFNTLNRCARRAHLRFMHI